MGGVMETVGVLFMTMLAVFDGLVAVQDEVFTVPFTLTVPPFELIGTIVKKFREVVIDPVFPVPYSAHPSGKFQL